jgi:hypothetical protein
MLQCLDFFVSKLPYPAVVTQLTEFLYRERCCWVQMQHHIPKFKEH